MLKFKLVFSLNRCPEDVHEGELAQRFQGFTVYKKDLSFDNQNRIIGKLDDDQDQIESDTKNPLGAGEVSKEPVMMSLDKCLEAASMKEIMKDQNAYQCGICKKE